MTIAFPSEETTSSATTSSKPKLPLSEKRLRANRLNALKSTGPRTPAGKQTVSHNATTHGLAALRAPDPRTNHDYAQLLAELREEHNPTTPTQTTIIHELANILWKLHHLPDLELKLLNTPLPSEQGEGTDTDHAAIANPQSAITTRLIATHFLQDTPTPLTRIYQHHHRLLARMTSLLRLLTHLKKQHLHHRQQQLQQEAEHEHTRRVAQYNAREDQLKRQSIEAFHRQHPHLPPAPPPSLTLTLTPTPTPTLTPIPSLTPNPAPPHNPNPSLAPTFNPNPAPTLTPTPTPTPALPPTSAPAQNKPTAPTPQPDIPKTDYEISPPPIRNPQSAIPNPQFPRRQTPP